MLRIAVIQRFLPGHSRGGVGYFTDGLCNELARRGHEVTVFSQDPAPAGARYRVVTLPAGASGLRRRLAPLVFPFQVARVDFSSFDVVHAQGDDQLLRRARARVRTLHGSSLVEAVHNGWRGRSPRRLLLHLYFYAGELLAVLRADAVVAVSRHTGRFYPRLHAVIPNGVDLDAFGGPGPDRSACPSILFVGELDSRKRGRWLVDLFTREVQPAVPGAELWLVCPERVARDGVRWFGCVSGTELIDLYHRAWVMCLPSSYEGFGRPYLEAMAAGTPVVATPNPGALEVLDAGRHGLIVPDERLGETLRSLLSRPDLRAEYGRLGAGRSQDFAWPVVAGQYEQIYARACGRRRAR